MRQRGHDEAWPSDLTCLELTQFVLDLLPRWYDRVRISLCLHPNVVKSTPVCGCKLSRSRINALEHCRPVLSRAF